VDIGGGEARLHADHQRLARRFDGVAAAQQLLEGWRGRASAVERIEDGTTGDRDAGPDLAGHRLLQQLRRLPGALVLIDMGIGPVGNQRIGIVRHHLRERRMQVEHRDNRDIRSKALAQPGEQFALAIIGAFGRHRAMEMQQHAVDAVASVQDVAREELEG
jgi:hypothetical protein